MEIASRGNGDSRVQIDIDGDQGDRSAKTLFSAADVAAVDLSSRANFVF